MPRPKSLIVSMEWTTVARAHPCRNNRAHLLAKGDPRLTIREDGDEKHYCVACARGFLAADVKRLADMLETAPPTSG